MPLQQNSSPRNSPNARKDPGDRSGRDRHHRRIVASFPRIHARGLGLLELWLHRALQQDAQRSRGALSPQGGRRPRPSGDRRRSRPLPLTRLRRASRREFLRIGNAGHSRAPFKPSGRSHHGELHTLQCLRTPFNGPFQHRKSFFCLSVTPCGSELGRIEAHIRIVSPSCPIKSVEK